MGWDESQLFDRGLSGDQGPGNALLITLEQKHVTNVFSELGEKMVRSETVARELIVQVRRFIVSGASVGENLVDQIMLPFALAGGGRSTTSAVTRHSKANAEIISRFLPVNFRFEKDEALYICHIESKK